jgi:F-type H+-transporting ATPase subunit delta
MKAHSETIARRLAQALLDAALEGPGGPEAVRQRLTEICQIFAQCVDARIYLEHPLVSSDAKETIIVAIAPDGPGSAPVRQLLRMLAARQALRLLPAIATRLLDLWNARRGVLAAEATSAEPLTPEVAEQLRRALERGSQRSVELTTTVTPELMGGVIVRVAGRVLDGSVRGRLQALRQRLRHAATL